MAIGWLHWLIKKLAAESSKFGQKHLKLSKNISTLFFLNKMKLQLLIESLLERKSKLILPKIQCQLWCSSQEQTYGIQIYGVWTFNIFSKQMVFQKVLIRYSHIASELLEQLTCTRRKKIWCEYRNISAIKTSRLQWPISKLN